MNTAPNFLLISLLVVVVGWICYVLIKRAYIKRMSIYRQAVSDSSPRCNALRQLNNMYQFSNIPPILRYDIHLTTKQKYDHFNLEDFFIDVAHENFYEIDSTIWYASENERLYRGYLAHLKNLPGPAAPQLSKENGVPHEKYLVFESELYDSLLIHPVCDTLIICTKYYTSPQGRNHYKEERPFTQSDFHTSHIQYIDREEQRNTVQYQRSLMTPKLRYQILQRDNFRCVLCGRDQSSSPLEVDHIQPVSKGGKTEPHNLRTLCRDCNRGKSDAFVPNGNN